MRQQMNIEWFIEHNGSMNIDYALNIKWLNE